jgi:hypothetical protein
MTSAYRDLLPDVRRSIDFQLQRAAAPGPQRPISARPEGGLITVTFPVVSNHAPLTPPQPEQATTQTR